MSFSIAPKDAPAKVEGALNGSTPTGQSVRERAIAKLMDTQATVSTSQNDQPVPNANKISPEELGAIKPRDSQELPKEDGQERTTESQTVEAAAEPEAPKAPEKAPEEPLSSQYAQLAKRERLLRAQAQELRTKTDALAAAEAAIKAREAAMEGNYISKDRFVKEPLKVMEETGMSYEQLVEQVMNQPGTPEARQQAQVIAKLEAKIAALEEGHQKVQKGIEDSQTQAYQSAVSQIRNDAKQLVYSSDDFEAVKATNSVEDVVELITKTFELEGKLLTVNEAAQMVEDHIAEEAYKLSQLKKIQKRLSENKAPAAPAQTSPSKQAAPQGEAKQMKTLTNNVSSSRQLSARERAILAMKGELKS